MPTIQKYRGTQKPRQRKTKRRGAGRLLAGPLVFVIIGTQIPFLATIVFSFLSWEAFYPEQRGFVGFKNYAEIFTRGELRAAIWVTIVITVSVVTLSLLIGTAIALMLNRSFRGRAVARTFALSPFLLVPIASALLWKHVVLNPSYGLINKAATWLASIFGSTEVVRKPWLSDHPLTAIIVSLVWQWTAFVMIIMLAGLQSVPQELEEAASIDGAGRTRVLRHITLPLLKPYALIAVLFCSLQVIQNFDAVFSMTQGAHKTSNIAYTVYRAFFQAQDYGLGAAMGVLVVLGTLLIILLGATTFKRLLASGKAN